MTEKSHTDIEKTMVIDFAEREKLLQIMSRGV